MQARAPGSTTTASGNEVAAPGLATTVSGEERRRGGAEVGGGRAPGLTTTASREGREGRDSRVDDHGERGGVEKGCGGWRQAGSWVDDHSEQGGRRKERDALPGRRPQRASTREED